MRNKYKIRQEHIIHIITATLAGVFLGGWAASWGGMIGGGVAGALAGVLGAVFIENLIRKRIDQK